MIGEITGCHRMVAYGGIWVENFGGDGWVRNSAAIDRWRAGVEPCEPLDFRYEKKRPEGTF